MNMLNRLWSHFTAKPQPSRRVALVLSGGGARGLAHIGAIEALLEQGYTITSISGTSMGAIVGGCYAANRLESLKRLVLRLTRKKLWQMVDISPGLNHIATGERLMLMLDKLLGDTRIEQLPVPFCCSASDVVSGEEMVFRSGLLKTAIRASISIPLVFKPLAIDRHVFVDGSLHNTLPLDRVERHTGDILVAMNVSAPDAEDFDACSQQIGELHNPVEKFIRMRLPFFRSDPSSNYMNMMLRVTKLSIQNNTRMAMRLTPPDICAEMPMNAYGLFDYDKAREIIDYGHRVMEKALTAYAAKSK